MTTKLDDISRAIGALEAGLKSLGDKIDKAEEVAAENRKAATAERHAIRERVEEVADDLTKVKTGLIETQQDVATMKPTVDEVRVWKQRGIGALAMAGIGGTALGVGLANSFEWFAKLFRGMG